MTPRCQCPAPHWPEWERAASQGAELYVTLCPVLLLPEIRDLLQIAYGFRVVTPSEAVGLAS